MKREITEAVDIKDIIKGIQLSENTDDTFNIHI